MPGRTRPNAPLATSVGGPVEVGVVPYDQCVLAAHLQLGAHPGRDVAVDRLADRGGAGERHGADPRVGDQRLADLGVAVHQRQRRAGHPGLDQRLDQPLSQQGRELAWLEHHAVAGRERRSQLAGGDVEREVPRGDRGHHADGLPHRHHQAGPRRLDALARDAKALAGVHPEVLRRTPGLHPGLGQGLALLADQLHGQLVGALGQQVRCPQEHVRAGLRRRVGPLAVALGDVLDGLLHVAGVAVRRDHRDLVDARRILALIGATGPGADPFPADEVQSGYGPDVHASSSSRRTARASRNISIRSRSGIRRSMATRATANSVLGHHAAADAHVPLVGLAQRLAPPDHGGELPLHATARAREQLGIADGDWVWIKSAIGRVKGRVRLMEGVNPDTVWTWNAIGRRAGAAALDNDAPEATRGFLLNHLITELLPEREGGYRFSNSDPITGQAAWYDLRVSIEKAAPDEPGETLPQFVPLHAPPLAKPRPRHDQPAGNAPTRSSGW